MSLRLAWTILNYMYLNFTLFVLFVYINLFDMHRKSRLCLIIAMPRCVKDDLGNFHL